MTATRPQVGVIGAGYWGRNLARNCAQLGVLGAVCDVDEAALHAMRSAYPGVLVTANVSDLLRSALDAVVIASPAALHAELALRAIAAGKHAFIEKPLALSVEDGRRVADAARRHGVQAFVGHLLLYHPAVKRLRALLSEGAIGTVQHFRSRRLSLGKVRQQEDVWWSFAPHDVALSLAVFGCEPIAASAARCSFSASGLADTVYADLEFPAARSAHIEVSWLEPVKTQQISIFGTEGVLTFDDAKSGATLRLTRCGIKRTAPEVAQTWQEATETVPFDGAEPLRLELEAFLQAVVSGRTAETDAEEGVAVLRALSLVDAALRRAPAEMPA